MCGQLSVANAAEYAALAVSQQHLQFGPRDRGLQDNWTGSQPLDPGRGHVRSEIAVLALVHRNDALHRFREGQHIVVVVHLRGDRTVAQSGIGAERGEADWLTPITRSGCVATGLGGEFCRRDGNIVGRERELRGPQRGAVDRVLIEDSIESKTAAKRAQR